MPGSGYKSLILEWVGGILQSCVGGYSDSDAGSSVVHG
jgi:hypothetical protein